MLITLWTQRWGRTESNQAAFWSWQRPERPACLTTTGRASFHGSVTLDTVKVRFSMWHSAGFSGPRRIKIALAKLLDSWSLLCSTNILLHTPGVAPVFTWKKNLSLTYEANYIPWSILMKISFQSVFTFWSITGDNIGQHEKQGR